MSEETVLYALKSVLGEVSTRFNASDYEDLEYFKNIDIISSGIIDSFGFIELIELMEENFSLNFDLSEINGEEFSTVSVLTSLYIKQNFLK